MMSQRRQKLVDLFYKNLDEYVAIQKIYDDLRHDGQLTLDLNRDYGCWLNERIKHCESLLNVINLFDDFLLGQKFLEFKRQENDHINFKECCDAIRLSSEGFFAQKKSNQDEHE